MSVPRPSARSGVRWTSWTLPAELVVKTFAKPPSIDQKCEDPNSLILPAIYEDLRLPNVAVTKEMRPRLKCPSVVTALLLFVACRGQTKEEPIVNTLTEEQMTHFELSPETAHPRAAQLMSEEFYWSPIEETGPFGNDDGSDALYGFRQWRQSNKQISPLVYLEGLVQSWGYPPFDWNKMDTTVISQYISASSRTDNSELEQNIPAMLEHINSMGGATSKQIDEAQLREIMAAASSKMGGTYLLGIDNAIIAVGFGQFALEGKIDEDILTLTRTAIQRELLPILINRWDGAYSKTRNEQLTHMLATLDKMKE